MDPLSFAVTLPAVPESVAVVRHVLGGTAGHWPVSEPALHDIRVAVSEACTDAIRRAEQDEAPGTVEVCGGVEGDAIVVRVTDAAASPPAGMEQREPGMLLVAALAERLQVGHEPGGAHRVTMTFATADPPR